MKATRTVGHPHTRRFWSLSLSRAAVVLGVAAAIALVSAQAVDSHAASSGSDTAMIVQTSTTDQIGAEVPSLGNDSQPVEGATSSFDRGSSSVTLSESPVSQATTSVASKQLETDSTSSTRMSRTISSASRAVGSANTEPNMVMDSAPTGLTVGAVVGISGADIPDDGAELTNGTVTSGIVMPSGAKFYVPCLSLNGGGAAGFQLALQNHSKFPAYAELDVNGLPSNIHVTALPIASNRSVHVVQMRTNAFMIELQGETVGSSANLEVQLIAHGAVGAGTYHPTIKLSGIAS